MKHEEAVRLNAEGKLTRKVLTEFGWYVPSAPDAMEMPAPALYVGDDGNLSVSLGPPPARILPPVKRRGRKKG